MGISARFLSHQSDRPGDFDFSLTGILFNENAMTFSRNSACATDSGKIIPLPSHDGIQKHSTPPFDHP